MLGMLARHARAASLSDRKRPCMHKRFPTVLGRGGVTYADVSDRKPLCMPDPGSTRIDGAGPENRPKWPFLGLEHVAGR